LYIKRTLFVEDISKLLGFESNLNKVLTIDDVYQSSCLKMKKWVDNSYDINLIESDLAFPMLEELTNSGDLIAKKIFKFEIIKRIRNHSLDNVSYLFQDPIYCKFAIGELKPILEELGLEYVLFNGEICGIVFNNRLDLRNRSINDLTKIDGLDTLTFLEELLLSNNQLNTIPDIILNLHSLKVLDLFSNQFKVFPETVIEMHSLESLNLGWNQMETLPDTIDNFILLKELYLGRNNLLYLPKSIGNIKTLQTLILNFNYLTELPESMGYLTSIKRLGLRSNNLLALPTSMPNLKSLEELDISFNNFRVLPDSLAYLDSLKTLYINIDDFNTLSRPIKILRDREVKINDRISYKFSK